MKREQQEHHRDDEMVGHHGRKHHEGEREAEHRHECGVISVQSDDVAHYAAEEYHGVETEENLYRRHDEYGAVDAGQPHQELVYKIRNVHVERQKRVSVDIVSGSPVAHHGISDGVETRYLEVADEQLPVVFSQRSEPVEVFYDDKRVHRNEHKQHYRREKTLLAPQSEYA